MYKINSLGISDVKHERGGKLFPRYAFISWRL